MFEVHAALRDPPVLEVLFEKAARILCRRELPYAGSAWRLQRQALEVSHQTTTIGITI